MAQTYLHLLNPGMLTDNPIRKQPRRTQDAGVRQRELSLGGCQAAGAGLRKQRDGRLHGVWDDLTMDFSKTGDFMGFQVISSAC